ncbi:hypothetical protein LSG31_00520 [Fodinisporobacter ferrooxydans]|uniref:Zinc-binding domain-containing protein n=1 Tax=Fodinisporobacter ferrooxydans TaxID=2901836 RepID=A0ABY4CMY1_9BACL|nr:hypothetical protein LSG31_00520 [Alicyclobacillaceae bacterium MYW30-H2]
MPRAFQGFRGNKVQQVLWQEHDSLFPFTCNRCRREFSQGGKRWLASSMVKLSHGAVGCECDDCHNGVDPLRKPAPVLASRRTELD